MNKFKEVLKNLRKEYGFTQKQLADKLGISLSAVSMYEGGKREPSFEILQKIADLLNVDMNYLLSGEKNLHLQNSPLGSQNPENTCITYAVIGEVAAGFGCDAVEEETGDFEQIPSDWISGHNPDEFFVLRVKGNSMYPQYIEGDNVLVHKQSSVDSGSVAVVIYENSQATLKKVKYVYGENWLDLVPINPEYQKKHIENSALEECYVLGKVVKLIRNLS